MKTDTVKSLKAIDELLSLNEYSEVISRLAKLEKANLTREEIAYVNLLFVRANIALGNYDIEDTINETIAYYRYSKDHEKFGRIKLCEGLRYVYNGNLVSAKESLNESLASYKRISHKKGQAIVLNRLAGVEFNTGDIASAIDSLRVSLSYLTSSDWSKVVRIKNNLAQLYIASGEIKIANILLREIEQKISSCGNESLINHNFRKSYIDCILGNYTRATDRLLRSAKFINGVTLQRFTYQEYLGWIHNLEGKYDLALTELTKGLKIAEDIAPESALMSQIKRRMADSYLGLKDYQKAELFASEALAVAEKLNERVEIAECWRIQAEIANHNQEPETAKGLFKKVIDMFNMISTKYNLAVCRYTAATSGLYHNGERQALLYLAREYFESEDVHHYIKKIDKALSEPQTKVQKKQQSDNSTSIVVAASPKMKKLVKLAEMIAPSPISVLLTGETGTGKDHLAKFIHDHSECEGEFVAVNIAAIPETMLEAELFGYRKGAFTGADQTKPGLFEQADKGTFFLNEVSAASAAIQAKLLDVLERRKIRRLGENKERDVSFRLLSASNRDLEEIIRKNEFRADLYHRIKQEEIKLPPLRERSEDILELVKHFLAQSGIKCHQDQAQLITSRYASHTWPGNVRELKAEIERLAMMNDNNLAKIIDSSDSGNGSEIEQLQILLEKYNWNRSKVASELGISEGGVRYRMRKFKLL